ncbi:MAG: response regulator transcription factor, partial [Chloroflexota bacterium]
MNAFIISESNDEGEVIKLILRQASLDVSVARDLDHVFDHWTNNWSDMLILAGSDNTVVLENVAKIRAHTSVPLLIITEPPAETELCLMLENGTDLVLSRPVSPRVLAHYTKVLLRRTETLAAFALPTLELDEIKLDPSTHTVYVVGKEPSHLTQLEFYLLYVLMNNRNQVVPTDVIVDQVWGYDGRGDRELVRGLISRLRRKLEPNSKKPHFIHTIPGVGYRF